MNNDELVNEMTTLRESINNKIDSLLTESADGEMLEKLNKVKSILTPENIKELLLSFKGGNFEETAAGLHPCKDQI